MRVQLGAHLECWACLEHLSVLVYAHDEGPRGSDRWYIPEDPFVAVWMGAHRIPKMLLTGEVLPR